MIDELTDEQLEQLLQMVMLPEPPYLMAGVGLLMGVLCGLTFGRQVQNKLDGWKEDRLPLLPLGTTEITISFAGTLIGITLFIGCCLQIFGFSAGVALLVAFVLSLLTGGALFAQLERLMQQVESGNFKAVDFDNFDEFF
ncbi:hypothetical protein [Synechococcus sp. CC9616]|jgi:hypothetical protein|uniref:hypothetical protein n=1 Tax=Synechococcus sp. CC9616 TaxID=110663 RepID=UPI00048FA734|nr:hypothetical protein [Synechococcus sp. CC9616]RPF83806.1 MAG: hypothetical protein CBB80_003280 [Synechococcus sp. TMED20]